MSLKNMPALTRLCLFMASVFLGATSLAAQLAAGTILGTVKDSSGGLVANAKVTVRNNDTGAVRTVTTGADGQFRIPALAVGTYEVKTESAGFKTESQT